MSIKLSIIIPHYNSFGKISKLLESIPDKKEIEVLVIDDKSDPKQFTQLKAMGSLFKFTTFKLIFNTKIKSAGTCRNIGLQESQGEWILFADADDYFTDKMYEVVAPYFKTKNDIVFFIPTSVIYDSNMITDRHIEFENLIVNYIESFDERPLRYRFMVPWSKLYNRKFLIENNILFDEVIAANDVMFSTKAGHAMKNFSVDENIIYVVTKNKGSLTMNKNFEIFQSRKHVFIRYYKFLESQLAKVDFDSLNLNGKNLVYNARIYGFIEIFKVCIELKSKNIKILSNIQDLKLSNLYSKWRSNSKKDNEEKKFHIK